MIKTILVGLADLEYSRSAVQHSIELANAHGVKCVNAVTLVDPARLSSGPVPIGAGEMAKELHEYRLQLTHDVIEESIGVFEEALQHANLTGQVFREEGDPCERMISCARYHDLVVVGLRNLFGHGVVEAVPGELLRLVAEGVRPLVAVAPAYRPIHRVLIAYSGSTESAKTMKRFLQLRLWPDATIRIVTFDGDATAAAELLQDAAKYCGRHGVDAETEYVAARPNDALLAYADEWNADLIVLGNSRRRYLLQRILGETTLKVVAHADRPLFLAQ